MFRLSRYYSITSFAGIAIIIIVLSIFFRQLAMQSLMEHQARANTDLTRSFANSIWEEFKPFIENANAFTVAELKQRPEVKQLDKITRQKMQGVSVVKVKIYNLSGLTVFSTDPSQIGMDKSKNPGFIQARSGEVASEITFRNEFYAFEQIIMDRNLIASYVPIRENETGSIIAVFEVYSDVTPLLRNIEKTQYKILLGILIALTILYLFLYIIIRRADKILSQQEHERKKNVEKIRHQAFHDALTGLPNRNSFDERIEEALSRANRHDKACALMYIDLDRFKLINDSLGHDAGDQLLRVTAERISKNLREMDMAFRMSGDEFVIILEDLKKSEDAAIAANRILATMKKPVQLDGYDVLVNMSIGITHFPKPDCDVDSIVKEADSAMYRAKRNGHNNIEFYTDELNTRAFERLALETDLLNAIKNREFILHYQPKYHTESSELAGVEALLRWPHREKGMIAPNEFIPLLEDMGEINAVGKWVLKEACSQAQFWIEQGYKPVRMSVNISAKQFRSEDLAKNVKEVLDSTGLDPQYLELELTESMFVEDTQHAIRVMEQLKKLGVSLSIDDFGSGYSSLSYLKQFPVDYLKIDRSFIKELSTNDKDASITTAITGLAHSLNLKVIAEGVENQEQIEFLRHNGCHELQGFFFHPALPPAEIAEIMQQGDRRLVC